MPTLKIFMIACRPNILNWLLKLIWFKDTFRSQKYMKWKLMYVILKNKLYIITSLEKKNTFLSENYWVFQLTIKFFQLTIVHFARKS